MMKQNKDLQELMILAAIGRFGDLYWQLMLDAAFAVHRHIENLEEKLAEYENDETFRRRQDAHKILTLEQRVEGLRTVAEEAERIANEAHLAADHYAYDLMRTVLRPLVGDMEMSVEQALAAEEETWS